MITALNRTGDRVAALEAGADDFMTKPVERVELAARVRSALRLKALYNTLDSAEQVIFSLAAAVEAKDPFTERHTQRVAETARHVGRRLGLPGSATHTTPWSTTGRIASVARWNRPSPCWSTAPAPSGIQTSSTFSWPKSLPSCASAWPEGSS